MLSVTLTVKLLGPTSELVGVPPRTPLGATVSQAGPEIFAKVSVLPFASLALSASVLE